VTQEPKVEPQVQPKSRVETACVAVDPKPEELVPEIETKEDPNGDTTASPEN
jgi:hypothetical protein